MYDIDGFETTTADVAALHDRGIKVVCYLSAGTWERFRPDAAEFPAAILGAHNGWPGERWLDVRDAQQPHSALLSIMDARLDMCAQKHFDAVELDNVDGYTNHTGFPLTAGDQLFYNTTLANAAHRVGSRYSRRTISSRSPSCSPTSTPRSTSSATSTTSARPRRTGPTASTSTSPRARRSSKRSTS